MDKSFLYLIANDAIDTGESYPYVAQVARLLGIVMC